MVEPKVFDLVEVTGIEQVLGVDTLPVGKYTQIRMDVNQVMVTHQGEEKKAELPGDKLKVVRPFDVVADQATVLTLDFDAAKSVVIAGNGQVRFKPTVKLLLRKEDRGQGSRPDVAGGQGQHGGGGDRPQPGSGQGRGDGSGQGEGGGLGQRGEMSTGDRPPRR